MLEKFCSFLHHCAKTRAFKCGIALQGLAIKTGAQADILTCNHILNFYAKCGCLDFARKLFDEMPQRNLVTWTVMISGYDQSHRPLLALLLFNQMQMYFEPNEFGFASALSSCSALKDLHLGQQIHALSLKLNHGSVSFVLNSLILMYMRCGLYGDAMVVFTHSKSVSLTLVSYNMAITALVESKQQEKGFEIFKIMCQQGLIPDRFTFAGLLGSGEHIYELSVIMQLHCHMTKLGLDHMAFSGNVLITLYSRFNLLEESQRVFWLIHEKDAISWNSAIAACCRCEDALRALGIFREMMMDHNMRPDNFTYASVLSATAGLANMRHGKEIHAHLVRTRFDLDVGVGNALLNMYAKTGSLSSSYTIFKQMEIHNLVSWNSIIAAFAYHGFIKEAIALFGMMMRNGMELDSVTFLELLTACNHSGLANEAQAIFNSMSEVYRLTPSVEHLCCLIDLLGRAGKINEAEDYTSKYCVDDDAVVLGCLLSACRLHGNIVVGERIAERLLKLQPVSTSPYVLLSNLYASDRKWDGVAGARKLLLVSGLRKEAAHSVIEVMGSMEKFVIGDFSHAKMDDMLNILKSLTLMNDKDLCSNIM